MKKLTVLMLTAGLMTSGAALAAGDAASGKALYDASCASCHGMQAQGQGMFPKLAGLSSERIKTTLVAFKAGDMATLKKEGLGGPNYAIMAPNAAGLSEQDMDNLTAYIITLK